MLFEIQGTFFLARVEKYPAVNGSEVPNSFSDALTAVIVNHEDGLLAVRQLKGYYLDNPEVFSQIDWLLIHNGTEPKPQLLDDDPEVQQALSQVELCAEQNRGYGAALNLALNRSPRRYLLALNADLMPESGFLAGLSQLIEELDHQDRIGIIGSALSDPDGTPQGSMGKSPTLFNILKSQLQPRSVRKYHSIGSQVPAESPWVTGACFILNLKCIEEIGSLDERFFMYYEDVDLCKRAWVADWKVMYDPRLTLRHFHPYHSRDLTLWMVYQSRRALLLYFWKHRPSWEFSVLLKIMRFECRFRGRHSGWEAIDEMLRRVARSPIEEWERQIGEKEKEAFAVDEKSRS